MLLDHEQDEPAVLGRLTDDFEMTPEEADAVLGIDYPAGYVHLSLRAIKRLLPPLERGLIYQSVSDPEQSALHAAGYLRRDELRRRLFDKLPDPQRAADCPVGDLPNPVVRRTLVELRKVVNAIVREYGKPKAVHVEMGRDVKTRPKQGAEAYRRYMERIREMREREDRRAKAVEALRELGVPVTRDSILLHLLWEDQNRTCVYSGKPISAAQLFSGEVHVDHILPYSRCLDDSQNNKVVCFSRENADKSDQTPYEWLAAARPKQYEQLCQRAGKLMRDGRMPYPKYRRFLQKELKLEDFIERQLNDTRYIARLSAEYLRCLFEENHAVRGVKGQLTAELRHDWGLNSLLAELPDSPAWQEQSKLRPGEKNRADHRHHAVDAVVIALTTPRRLWKLAELRKPGGRNEGELALDPWTTFREDLKEALQNVNVSHRADRKISGQLHEETLYGKTEQPAVWVSRKPVESLSANEIESIRDGGIKKIVIDKLRENGIEFGRGKKIDPKAMKAALTDLRMPSGVPIRKVRLTKSELTIRPIREGLTEVAYVKPGSMHHLCIFEFAENGKTRRDAVFVSMLEASRRLKSGEPIVQRTHPKLPDAEFVMSLSRGDAVLADWKGQEKLLVLKTASSTQGQIWFANATDARRSADYKQHVANANTLKGRKVTVDSLGRIRWAND